MTSQCKEFQDVSLLLEVLHDLVLEVDINVIITEFSLFNVLEIVCFKYFKHSLLRGFHKIKLLSKMLSFFPLKYILLIMLLQFSQFFPPLYFPSTLYPPRSIPRPLVHVHRLYIYKYIYEVIQNYLFYYLNSVFWSLFIFSLQYKFFGFSISYTILNLPLSIL